MKEGYRNENSFESMIRQDKERSAEQAKQRKQEETFVIVHHERPDGGYVVRTATNNSLPYPYHDSKRYGEYKRKSSAQEKADKLNEDSF